MNNQPYVDFNQFNNVQSKIKHDKKEEDPKYRTILDAAEQEAEEECKEFEGQMGYCHALWNAKKRILVKKYNVQWKTPAELNRNIIFD
ncbi:MAG TPA: hypothetical protein VKK79_06540 [Candidatus Lokiarchaeia archaeon]|nr:hypothetical protein [Candidatus Lokiarchaeia archaeon]